MIICTTLAHAWVALDVVKYIDNNGNYIVMTYCLMNILRIQIDDDVRAAIRNTLESILLAVWVFRLDELHQW